MEINVIVQPDVTFGEILIENLKSNIFENIWIISAFANRNAVLQLAPHIIKAKTRGANIRIFVGIDLQSTSEEALSEVISLEINAKVIHNKLPGHTFHPKIYLFEKNGDTAILFVGSNNLTEGGLYSNYEASVKTTFNFPEDEIPYQDVINSLQRFLNPSGSIVQPLTKNLVQILVERGQVLSESEVKKLRREIQNQTRQRKTNIPVSPFGQEKIKRAPKLPSKQNIQGTTFSGDLVWEKKNLPATDVQRQKGKITGGLRLTQAKWIGRNGKVINQTTYFRNDIFGKLEWKRWKGKPRSSEKATAKFNVEILGKSYGLQELEISHKPSGEAGQGNYTTMLHWGIMTETIRQLDLRGKTFRLYAPPKGQREPFKIEII